jgi:hypothetical protein
MYFAGGTEGSRNKKHNVKPSRTSFSIVVINHHDRTDGTVTGAIHSLNDTVMETK